MADIEVSARLKPLSLHAWSELHSLERKRFLIKGLLQEGGLSVIYGESNSGKTFIAIDIAAHISLGHSWQNRSTAHGTVIYIAAESGLGIADRLNAFRIYHEINPCGSLFVLPQSILLWGESNDCSALIHKIKATANVKLVIVDTLARVMAGGNENSSEDMGSLIHCCDLIREETGAHVMIIHHSGKNAERGARGHSSLRAAIDTEIKVSQNDGIVTAEVVKQRDGKTGDHFSFELQQVNVGTDDDGLPITSCILSPSDIVPKRKSLPAQKRRALNILRNALAEKGTKRSIRSGMVPVVCVTLDEYRDYLQRERISSSDKSDTVNKAITRAIDELNNAGITASYNEHIWIVDRQDKQRQSIFGNPDNEDRQDTTL